MVDAELLESQLRLIAERWPSVGAALAEARPGCPDLQEVSGREGTFAALGVQLSSRHDRRSEARLQRGTFGAARSVFVYGPGLGDLERALLEDEKIEVVHVKILSAAIFAAVLSVSDQRDWLADARVTLSLARADEDIFEPYFVLPPELVLAEDEAWKIRDRLHTELNARHVGKLHRPDDPVLRERLAATRGYLERDGDVRCLFGSEHGRSAYVFASGPSLEDHLDRLAANFSGSPRPAPSPLLVCVDTAYRTLIQRGIRPHVVVTMDRHLTAERVIFPGTEATALVYFPLTDPGIVEAWQGPRYAAYSGAPLYERLRAELPRGVLWSGGSILHSAVDLVVLMGAGRVTLFGADFAFISGKTHAGWESGELGKDLLKADYWVKNSAGERLPSSLNFASYRSELERYIRARPNVAFHTTTSRGAVIGRAAPDPDYYL